MSIPHKIQGTDTGDTNCVTRLIYYIWGSAQVGSSICAQVKSCSGQGQGQGQPRRGTRERQVGSTLAAEAQAISATCAASRTPARAVELPSDRSAIRPVERLAIRHQLLELDDLF